MAFDLPTSDIVQAAINTMYSFNPIIAIFVGIAIAGFVAHTLMAVIRARRQ